MFAMRSQSLLSDGDWKELNWLIRNLGARRQSVLAAWMMFKGSFEEPFQRFMDDHLPGTDKGMDAGVR
jgi:hypothetical protein